MEAREGSGLRSLLPGGEGAANAWRKEQTPVAMSGRETVGERLRRLRTARGFSQREISSPGVSYAYISRIEAGTRTPSVKALRILAGRLGVPEEYLEYGERPVDNAYVESELRRVERLLAEAAESRQTGAVADAQGIIGALLEYMTNAEARAAVVERLAEEERKRQEFEQLRARFASDEQMREALGNELADQVVDKLGERAAALRR
jgi:transcriptional regulator with XRE-family HTH domain